MDLLEIYETEDRNFLLYAAAVIDRVVSLKSKAMRDAERSAGG